MKALVLAGGSGTRLRPFTYSMPKQLIPVGNKPVLEYVIENAREIGVTEIGVIVGGGAAQIRSFLGDGSRLGVRITYLTQELALGLAHCVLVAGDFLGGDDFVMLLGDNMLPDGIAGPAAAFAAHRPTAQLVVHRVADPSAFGVAEVAAGGRVRRVVEKPAEPAGDLALIGVYFFTAAVHRAVRAVAPGARGELEITDAIQWLVDAGEDVRAGEYHGYWKDTGRVEDVLDCNRTLLDRLKPAIDGEVDAASTLIGSVVVEPGARVVRSIVRGPVVIGAGSVVQDSRLGPYTAVGRDCRVRDTWLDNSIALDGASISGVRGLRDSLIGRHARVDSGAGDGHRMVVGDHTTVEVVA